MERSVTIYCDGACRGNPGPGGYAAIIRSGGRERTVAGAEPRTTNNRMELTAAIKALESLEGRSDVTIVTDSQYLKNGITVWIHAWRARGWRTSGRKAVLNRDLWERLLALSGEHSVQWEWVAGHAGDELNERCDRLANEAIDEILARSGGRRDA
ncbi:MAG: ribonuclease HI [Planctomycetota bacterium]